MELEKGRREAEALWTELTSLVLAMKALKDVRLRWYSVRGGSPAGRLRKEEISSGRWR